MVTWRPDGPKPEDNTKPEKGLDVLDAFKPLEYGTSFTVSDDLLAAIAERADLAPDYADPTVDTDVLRLVEESLNALIHNATNILMGTEEGITDYTELGDAEHFAADFFDAVAIASEHELELLFRAIKKVAGQ